MAIALAGAAAATSTAYAAGIGKLTVMSALGQPLRAEIALSATPDELSSLSASLASQDQFLQQGMDYTAAVASLHFNIEKHADGEPYISLSSDRPINEPFLDILVVLSWASGRLTREYTFLLDPANQPHPGNSSVTAPNVAPVPQSAVPPMSSGQAVAAPVWRSKHSSTSRPVAPAPAAASASSASTAAGVSTVAVKHGDTLGKIAADTLPEGASLDQMLVALYDSNRDAFIGSNLNRLKAGKILNVPDRATVLAISPNEAKKTVALQARNFNAYRKQLAAAAAAGTPTETPASQSASGKITPKVEDKIPAPAAGQDKLEISKSESGKAGKNGGKAAAEADQAAEAKQLKDAEARVAALEKNVADLKRLNELQSQSLAEAEKKAGSPAPAAPPPAPAVAKTAAAKTAETTPAAAKADVAKSATQTSAAAKPAHPAPHPRPRKPIVPPPAPEPGFMDEYGSYVSLGGALVVLLGGLFGLRAYRRRKAAALDAPTNSQLDEISTTSSVFGTTGGQSVNTNDVSLATGFSETSLTGNESAAGVDPVAEAEVYMAYGRDAQAEEILQEALKTDPTREAVHLKLLELYASRKSLKPFEDVARSLKQQTGGTGPNWERAITLGQSIDPSNPLYGGISVPSDAAGNGGGGTGTIVMQPGQLAKLAEAAEDAAVHAPEADAAAAPAEPESFDLDLGGTPEAAAVAAVAPLDFDLDLGAAETPKPAEAHAVEAAPATASAAAPLDFNLDLPPASTSEAASAASASTAKPADKGLDFDFNLDLPGAGAVHPDAAAPAAPSADLSGIDLNLDTPPAEAVAAPSPAPVAGESHDAPVEEADNPEVATKLELAQAYEEMGDKEGMRELLQEVLAEGNAAQQELARSKLALHGF